MKNLAKILGIGLLLISASMSWAADGDKLVKNTKRIGVLTVSISRVGDDRVANQSVRQAILQHANENFTAMLTSLSGWKVVPAKEMANLEGINDLNVMSGAIDVQKALNKLADQNQLPMEDDAIMKELMLAAMSMNMKKMNQLKEKAIVQTANEMQSKVDATTKNRQALPGLPVLSLGAVEGYFGNKTETQEQLKAMDKIFEERVSAFCRKNNLDAVAIFYIAAEAGHVGDTFVSNGDRTNGHVKANTSVRFIHQNPKFSYNYGYPRMDDLAPFKLNTPIYVGVGHLAAIPENIDLADPKSETLTKFNELVEDANKKLEKGLRKKLKLDKK